MPILDPNSFEFLSRSAEQTRRVGIRLGSILEMTDLVCLEGELGTGKTTFVQGLASGWGSLDAVSSPTFILVNIYRRPDGQRLAHLDAYRLSGPDEAEPLDLDTLLRRGPMVVEWSERIAAALPDEHLWVQMRHVAEEQRGMQFSAKGPHYRDLLQDLHEHMFGAA